MARRTNTSVWRNRIVGYGDEDPAKLLANPFNFRIHPDEQKAALSGALRQVGIVQNVLVNKTTGHVLDGHLRAALAIQDGQRRIPVTYVEMSEDEERIILATYDKISSMAEIDQEILDRLIGEIRLGDVELDPDVDSLIQSMISPDSEDAAADGLTDPDDAPEPPTDPVTRTGDLWLLGRHRVLCGDSTQVGDVERLMDGKKADMVFTDPPYGISAVKGCKVGGGATLKFGKVGGDNWVDSKPYAEIENDDSTDVAREFFITCRSFGISNFIIWGGNYFADFLPPSPCWLVWDKRNTGNFADVELAWTSYKKGAKLYPWLWNGLSRAGDRKSELVSRVHPTQKPVGLFSQIFSDFEFKSCLDGFLGSGSTLIACEKSGRSCYGMEQSPAYVDVIVRRWQDFTGQQATLDGDGPTFNQLADMRMAVPA